MITFDYGGGGGVQQMITPDYRGEGGHQNDKVMLGG